MSKKSVSRTNIVYVDKYEPHVKYRDSIVTPDGGMIECQGQPMAQRIAFELNERDDLLLGLLSELNGSALTMVESFLRSKNII